MVLLTRLPERRNIGVKRYSVKMKRLLHKMPGSKVFSKDEVPLTRLPCARGADPQSGPEGSFVDFRDKLSTLQPQFVYKNNPPAALRAPAPFTQGGLAANHHSLADPDNLLTPISYIIMNYIWTALTCAYMSAKMCAQSSA